MLNTLLPSDNYMVINKTILYEEDKKIITMLYQPIIGPLPVMLYFTLCSDLDKSQVISPELNHHHLITSLHFTCEELELSRNKLEGIGLIKTYLKKDENNNYVYELYSPLSVKEFFSHPILNVVLYNNVGKKQYEELMSYFKVPKFNKEGYTDITHSFSDVYETVPYTSFDIVSDNVRKYNKLKLNINSNFDINFLIETLPKHIDREKIFTESNKELIINLAYLYDIDATKMQDILRTCIKENGSLSKEELRKTVRNYYQFDHSGILPTVIEHSQPEYLRKPVGDNSKLSKLIYLFETTSPLDFLRSKSGGSEPVKRDVRLLENLIVDYGLNPGVVNVLVDYVLKTNNNNLSRSLAETIAGQWKRNNVLTVEEAINLARKEHKKYSKNTQKSSKVISTPEWFDKDIQKVETDDISRSDMESLLKEYKR